MGKTIRTGKLIRDNYAMHAIEQAEFDGIFDEKDMLKDTIDILKSIIDDVPIADELSIRYSMYRTDSNGTWLEQVDDRTVVLYVTKGWRN